MTLPPLETCSFSVQKFFYVICFSNNFKFWIPLYAFGLACFTTVTMPSLHGERGPDNQSVPSARPDGGVNGRNLSKNWTCLQMSPSLSPAKSSKAPLTPINTVLCKIILRLL